MGSTLQAFASTRSVQIATSSAMQSYGAGQLCLHTLRADCNIQRHAIIWRWTTLPPHAPCRLQQHPSCGIRLVETALPPHAPCRLQRGLNGRMVETENFASTRSVQIATPRTERGNVWAFSLPPHAPCRLQPYVTTQQEIRETFASTRSVQIATSANSTHQKQKNSLPPHAPCRLQQGLTLKAVRKEIFASTRSVQIATLQMVDNIGNKYFASTRSVQIATSQTVFFPT